MISVSHSHQNLYIIFINLQYKNTDKDKHTKQGNEQLTKKNRKQYLRTYSIYIGVQPFWTLVISSSQSLVSSSASFSWRGKKNKKLEKYWQSSRPLQINTIFSLTLWSRLFSSDCTFSCSRRSWAWSAETSALYFDRTSAISSFALRVKNECQLLVVLQDISTIVMTDQCFLLGNFLLSVGFKCLVALFLLFDSCQIVLSTSFQSLFILEKRHKENYPSNHYNFCERLFAFVVYYRKVFVCQPFCNPRQHPCTFPAS